MKEVLTGRTHLHVEVERWPLAAPFRIAGYTFEVMAYANGEITCPDALWG